MNEEERADVAKQSNALRLELKLWEKKFAAANEGRKASREDIKSNPDIAKKYKEYNRISDILSGKVVPPPPQSTAKATPRKRKYEDEHVDRAIKRPQVLKTPLKTPSKTAQHPWELDPYDSPSVTRTLFTPSKKTAIGPTPQKDGQVLGLFDLLGEKSVTPKKPGPIFGNRAPLGATPRKSGEMVSMPNVNNTPLTGKRFMDKFSTPSRKTLPPNAVGGNTPSSVSKLHFNTPSFLRRDSYRAMPIVDENNESLQLSPQMVRVPRKPIVRGLSSILAGLRKIEEDAADEDLEALREMENMENGMVSGTKSAAKPIVRPAPKAAPPPTIASIEPSIPKPTLGEAILVQDSQPRFPLGGFDDEGMYDTDPEEIANPTLGRDGQPLKVYKKKGQKRTTRKVNMKPTRSKPQTQPSRTPADEDSEDELGLDPETVSETQRDDDTNFDDGRNFESDSQSEYTASEGGTRYRRPDQSKKAKRITKDGKIRTATRKVTAMASQNFKRLKLRNSGAKGGPAHNSKFRRKK